MMHCASIRFRMKASVSALLNQRFAELRDKNPRYSVRAFARDLSLDAGFLSHVLNGKRKLSVARAIEVAERLKLNSTQKRLFLVVAQFEATTRSKEKQRLAQELSRLVEHAPVQSISVEQYRILSDWYHFAILEMTEDPEFDADPSTISRRLGIPHMDAKLARERLLQIGLLQNDGSKIKKTAVHFSPPQDIVEIAYRQRHSTVLDKAKEALNDIDPNKREFFSITMCIDPELLPIAKERIRDFAWDLCRTLESGKRKEIHELAIQLFPLEKIQSKKRNTKNV